MFEEERVEKGILREVHQPISRRFQAIKLSVLSMNIKPSLNWLRTDTAQTRRKMDTRTSTSTRIRVGEGSDEEGRNKILQSYL